ncbi:MAG: murein biosynthesis integral membrane protein MurJ [Candidatus Pacebacteria bacterium]|nr:murein biosynthesis integral membrane protein MurJ [Candidatus Paceibacterota bacterium]
MIARFQKILNHKSETIFGAAILTSGLTLLGSFLGLLRNAFLASRFGASGYLDIYYASFRLPDLIYNIFIMGAISLAFIPVFSEYWAKNKEEAWQFANAIIMVIGIFIGILALIVAIFARPFLSRLLVGFNAEQLELAIVLTRIMMIQPILMGISSVVASILKIFKLFLSCALAPLLYNIGIIIGILVFSPMMGLKGLAWGVVLGAALHLAIQAPALMTTGYKFKFNFQVLKERIAGLKNVFLMMIPRSLSIIANQVFLLGITVIATMLEQGSLAVFNFANDIQNLPQTVFALSFAVAAFPALSQFSAEKKQADFAKTSLETLSQIFFFLIPIAVWFIVFREPIIRLLLGYGKFDWASTLKTIQVFSILSLGMIFQGANALLLRIFFAKKDALKPFIASIISYALGFLLCYKFGLIFGVGGLALAVTLTYLFYFLILAILLKPVFSSSFLKEFRSSVLKILFVSLVSGLIAFLLFNFLEGYFPSEKVVNLVVSAAISFMVSLACFLFLCFKLGIKEIQELKTILIRKIYKANE